MAAGDWKEILIAAQNGDLALVRYHIRMGENPNYQHPEFLTNASAITSVSHYIQPIDISEIGY